MEVLHRLTKELLIELFSLILDSDGYITVTGPLCIPSEVFLIVSICEWNHQEEELEKQTKCKFHKTGFNASN